MEKPILLYGNDRLRTRSEDVHKGLKLNIEPLINDMFETMNRAKGIGLSAIQVGVPLRLFVVDAQSDSGELSFRGVFINPKIIKESGPPIKYTEGCLSIPFITGSVERRSEVELEWYNEKWEKKKKKFTGMEARIIQHEMDHLDGVLFIDRLEEMWKEMIKPALENIAKREIEPPYRYK
jgi:peptide deformylase